MEESLLNMNQRQAISKNNYMFFLMDGALFFLAQAFLSQDGLIPVFIDTYTGSVTLVGFTVTIKMLSLSLPKIVLGHKLGSIKNMPRFTAILMLITRPLILFMIPVLSLVENPRIIMTVFLVIYVLTWAGQSIVGLVWTDMFGRTMESGVRGKIQGYQQLLGGIGGLGAGAIVKSLLDSPNLGDDVVYMIIFGLAGLCMLGSGVVILFVKDIPRKQPARARSFVGYLKSLPSYLHEHQRFRKVSFVSMLSRCILLGNPFVILVAKNVIDVDDTYITTLIYIQISGTLLGGFIWGNISQKLGNLKVITLSNKMILVSAIATSSAIIMGQSSLSITLITLSVLMGGINASCWVGYVNYTLDIAGEGERIDMMVVQSILMLPISFIGYFMGLVVNQWGYLAVFLGIVVMTIVTLKTSFGIETDRL